MVASFRERLLEDRCCWIVFIHIVRGRPGGLLQFSKWEAVNVFLASVSSGIHAILKAVLGQWPKGAVAWVVRLNSSLHTWWCHLIPNSFHKHH